MALIKAILHKAKSFSEDDQHADKKYVSPPPEIDETVIIPKPKKRVYKYAHIVARVDSSPPRLDISSRFHNLKYWHRNHERLYAQNYRLLMQIRRAQLLRGRVDSHWSNEPRYPLQYFRNRVDFLNRVHGENLNLYKRITNAHPRVQPTASLKRDWCRNRREMVLRAENSFVLLPPIHHEEMEDSAFAAPPGVKRPRVYMTIGLRDCAAIGELCIELFTDVCPQTCRLFTELLDGDSLGHGYVGTYFFRKVPHLYWSGGDVTHNNGFGCYAQKGRTQPIGAENYHFPHSMPGLLSMRVTCDNEVCGIFNITFKPLPQFDLHNVVFGRIIRPSITYDTARVLGSALSSYPVVQVCSTRRLRNGRLVTGERNTRLIDRQQWKVFIALFDLPGLLSMGVTCDNEVCGNFNITFKPLPQFDLHNVVFGRIIRPSITYDTARVLGSALSSYPVVQVCSTRRLRNGRLVTGEPNTRLATITLDKARQTLLSR